MEEERMKHPVRKRRSHIAMFMTFLVLGVVFYHVTICASETEILTGEFKLGLDSLVHKEVPQGHLAGPFEFHSDIFKGTVRRYKDILSGWLQ